MTEQPTEEEMEAKMFEIFGIDLKDPKTAAFLEGYRECKKRVEADREAFIIEIQTKQKAIVEYVKEKTLKGEEIEFGWK